MTVQTPYRYDVVGSFLRPEKLKQARKDYEAKKISKEELKSVEDACITDLIQKEKTAGLHVITDGEFRRATWHLDFMWGFDGVSHTPTKTGLPFHGEAAMIDDTYITGKVGVNGTHPFVEHFKFVKQFEDENTIAKQTIPAPAQFLEQMILPFAMENTKKYYEDTEELVQDIANGYKVVIQQLYDAGCRCIQFDDCSWGMLVDEKAPLFFQTDQEGLLKVQELFLRINNLAIEDKPEDLTINTHICRGNFRSTWFSSGGYEPVAKILFGQCKVDGFFLEYDSERSGDFSPLRFIKDQKVVLGLITSKFAELEDKEEVKKRIQEAEQYVKKEQLCLSPQCGFSSTEEGNIMTEDEQWAKVKLVKEIAEEVWR